MGNPRKSDMDQHTKQKVAIYDAYLKRYLKIISQGGYPRVNLYDPCAGKGKYGEYDGSAVVACNNIRAHASLAPKEGFHLFLNEPDSENREELTKVCSYDFVECIDEQEAESFILKHCSQKCSGHKLWFIDPYGYTQVRKSSIAKIMSKRSTEVLLFIPLTFIYRFLKGLNGDGNLQSIARFLKDYSIAQEEAESCSSAPEFADLISRKLQGLYGYSWHATMEEGPLHYSIVFIGKHHYGLEKFLEARDKILNDRSFSQFSLIPMGEERDLLALLPRKGAIDNCQMYVLGLKNGYTPSGARKCLASLEERRLIHVKTDDGVTRKKGFFYLGKQYFKEQDRRIEISVLEEQGSLI